ncbi:hypothetical protein COLO4_38205 [Corchorus olitorius]|uniref:Uncharacterized protein n=1 Tax=Corchorus olitorius TaxID=93759 RepID=A0A1R3FWE6_9ROSI|nr:hypothetical protein COLO4_38205 [Corchorus olitorius]
MVIPWLKWLPIPGLYSVYPPFSTCWFNFRHRKMRMKGGEKKMCSLQWPRGKKSV